MSKKYSFEQISELADELTVLKKKKENKDRIRELQKVVKDWVADNRDAFKALMTQSQTAYKGDSEKSKLVATLKKKGKTILAKKVQKVMSEDMVKSKMPFEKLSKSIKTTLKKIGVNANSIEEIASYSYGNFLAIQVVMKKIAKPFLNKRETLILTKDPNYDMIMAGKNFTLILGFNIRKEG